MIATTRGLVKSSGTLSSFRVDFSYISQSLWTGDIWFHPRFMYNICILLPFLAAISAILAIVL